MQLFGRAGFLSGRLRKRPRRGDLSFVDATFPVHISKITLRFYNPEEEKNFSMESHPTFDLSLFLFGCLTIIMSNVSLYLGFTLFEIPRQSLGLLMIVFSVPLPPRLLVHFPFLEQSITGSVRVLISLGFVILLGTILEIEHILYPNNFAGIWVPIILLSGTVSERNWLYFTFPLFCYSVLGAIIESVLLSHSIISIQRRLVWPQCVALVLSCILEIKKRKNFFSYRKMTLEQHILAAERQRKEQLLSALYPPQVVEQLKGGERHIYNVFTCVPIFISIVNFDDLALSVPPTRLFTILNYLFNIIDQVLERYHIEKIKSISCRYLAVSGLFEKDKRDHSVEDCAYRAALAATEIRFKLEKAFDAINISLSCRIGISSGEIAAALVGTVASVGYYEVVGEPIGEASALDLCGNDGGISCTKSIYKALRKKPLFNICYDKQMIVKGHSLEVYSLNLSSDFDSSIFDDLSLSTTQRSVRGSGLHSPLWDTESDSTRKTNTTCTSFTDISSEKSSTESFFESEDDQSVHTVQTLNTVVTAACGFSVGETTIADYIEGDEPVKGTFQDFDNPEIENLYRNVFSSEQWILIPIAIVILNLYIICEWCAFTINGSNFPDYWLCVFPVITTIFGSWGAFFLTLIVFKKTYLALQNVMIIITVLPLFSMISIGFLLNNITVLPISLPVLLCVGLETFPLRLSHFIISSAFFILFPYFLLYLDPSLYPEIIMYTLPVFAVVIFCLPLTLKNEKQQRESFAMLLYSHSSRDFICQQLVQSQRLLRAVFPEKLLRHIGLARPPPRGLTLAETQEQLKHNFNFDQIEKKACLFPGFLALNHSSVVVLCADIVDFHQLITTLGIQSLVRVLTGFFRAMDMVATMHSFERVKLVGDSCLYCLGMNLDELNRERRSILASNNNSSELAGRAIRAALAMHQRVSSLVVRSGSKMPTPVNSSQRHFPEQQHITIRIGISLGRVVSGVVGTTKKVSFDIIGPAVDLASVLATPEAGTPRSTNVTLDIWHSAQQASDDIKKSWQGKIAVNKKSNWVTLAPRTRSRATDAQNPTPRAETLEIVTRTLKANTAVRASGILENPSTTESHTSESSLSCASDLIFASAHLDKVIEREASLRNSMIHESAGPVHLVHKILSENERRKYQSGLSLLGDPRDIPETD